MSGRKLKFHEKSKVICFRVPESKAEKLKEYIQKFIDKATTNNDKK